MKFLTKLWIFLALFCAVNLIAQSMPAPENPATGIWIQQKGSIVNQPATHATLYYTKFGQQNVDAVKSLQYHYNGEGFLQLLSKDTLCGTNDGMHGADGIVHHPDGDLLIAAQGANIDKISKTAKNKGERCMVKNVKPSDGVWHLMNDPSQKWVWAAGIPGKLHRFSIENDPANSNLATNGYQVKITPHSSNRRKDTDVTTVIWDGDGNAFFTYSDYMGGGCETDIKGKSCDENLRKRYRANSYFGYFYDSTTAVVTERNKNELRGKVGDTVVTELKTKILIDSLEGAHGGTYDKYSNTIFIFGGARIVQIKPYKENGEMKARVVAYIDLREYFFQESEANLTGPRTPSQNDGNTATWSGNSGFTQSLGWRLDQGTVDGLGHLFVASNTGHLVFVDYAANPQKYISDNVLVHIQWIDNYLDDLAPLTGVGIDRKDAETNTETQASSSSYSSAELVIYSSSSEAKSSSSKTLSSSSMRSSSSAENSSSSALSSSSEELYSSFINEGDISSSSIVSDPSSPHSSGSLSSNSNENTSSSSGNIPGSSEGNSSNSQIESSGENASSSAGINSSGDLQILSSSANEGSGLDIPMNSSSSNAEGSGLDIPMHSSSSASNAGGLDIAFGSSSSNRYAGFTDFDLSSSGTGIDFYPSQDKFDKGDSLVSETVVLLPVDSANATGKTVVIGENTYLVTNNPSSVQLDLRYNSRLDSAQVGQVVAITLDSSQVAKIFGDKVDSLVFATKSDISIIDPTNPSPSDTIKVANDGSLTIWVTTDTPIQGGSIIVADPGGTVVIIDNINFYDPIPDADKGFIKDSNGDEILDYLEIALKDTLEKGIKVHAVALVLNGDTLNTKNPIKTARKDIYANGEKSHEVSTINLDVSDIKSLEKYSEKFPEDAFAIITYENADGTLYTRTAKVSKIDSNIIKTAHAIRNLKGKDSLFIEFNIDLLPTDLASPEMIVLLNETFFKETTISEVYMPTKNIIILVGDSLGLKGAKKDSVALHPSAKFATAPYLTADEFDRTVPVSLVDRLPSVTGVEYWDRDSDGSLDQIVAQYAQKITAKDLENVYMTFPWYSDRGFMVQLQAQPADFKIDPTDSTRVIWDVRSTTQLIASLTNISSSLPPATVFTYYEVFGQTFISEENPPLIDKMAPVIVGATLNYGKKSDTLTIKFSEPIMYKGLEGRDFFAYIHGADTLDLLPSKIEWSDDGYFAKLLIDGSVTTVMPGDSLMVVKGKKDNIRDNYENIAGENPSPVVIAGLLNHLVEGTKMGTFDPSDARPIYADATTSSDEYTLQTVSSVNLRYMPSSTTTKDMEKEGALGHLVQLGERFVPQLLNNAQISADGSVDPSVLDSLSPDKVFITFVVNYYDHLGQYVNDTTIVVPCNSPKFAGNCLETDKKVFVNWNFKDHTGRFVGSGIYMVQFKMVVRYEKKKIEEEIKDKWGVRRKKHKKK